MKSNLSQILPVSEAGAMLGNEFVHRIVRSYLHFRTPNRPPTADDVTVLVNAILFDPGENDVPQNILTTWNRLTRRTSGLEKPAFIRFMVPANAAPFAGAGGHMGLYDCWVHAVSASANNYTSTLGNPTTPVVLLPDILIVVAVCREYLDVQSSDQRGSIVENLASRQDYSIMMLSILAFRVYDSYQKKGTVTRDTIHRFLTDVHGEDSYKTTPVRRMLDLLFMAPEDAEMDPDDPMAGQPARMLPHLTPGQFANAIRRTLTGKTNKHHVLLDWIATLGAAMAPYNELPASTQAYLDTLSSTHRSMETLCTDYGLASLYEIKRRFHSLVESKQVVQGDIMKEAAEEEKVSARPRHVISKEAFVKAVSTENTEMGHGGYLPKSLAELVFTQAACPSDLINDANEDGSEYWALYDLLQFSCVAIRHHARKQRGDVSVELPLIRFVFKMFCSVGVPHPGADTRVMTRAQIGRMLLLLLEHQSFRAKADCPPEEDEVPHEDIVQVAYVGGADDGEIDEEKTTIDASAASRLGLLPPKQEKAFKDHQVDLGTMIEYVLDQADMDVEELSFDGLCKWYYRNDTPEIHITQRRLGPLLREIKMISAVQFGVPPTRASMERYLVAEAQRRHRSRHPQTETAKRGPRGTIWYIIDDKWFRSWTGHVQRVEGSDADFVDNREDAAGSPRGLGKINNTSLLSENGLLTLRSDIRWRQDYEIVPPLVWSSFQAWYDGGPPIHRTVVRYIPSNGAPSVHSRSPRIRTEFEIELYPFFVTIFLCDTTSRGEARPFQQFAPVSRVSPVRVLLIQLCKGLSVDPKFGRLWVVESDIEDGEIEEQSDWLLSLDSSIMEQRNRRGGSVDTRKMTLLLELKDADTGKWPRGADGKNWIMKENRQEGLGRIDSDTGNGVVGLYNMG